MYDEFEKDEFVSGGDELDEEELEDELTEDEEGEKVTDPLADDEDEV